MRAPEDVTYGSMDEDSEPPRLPGASWGVGPWPVQTPRRPHSLPIRLAALCARTLRVIILHRVREPLSVSRSPGPLPRRWTCASHLSTHELPNNKPTPRDPWTGYLPERHLRP
jgi:hypothetical protein